MKRLVLVPLALVGCAGPAAVDEDPAVVAQAPSAVALEVPPIESGSSVRLPPSVDLVLDNGIRVFLVQNHEAPLVSFHLRLAGGSVEDPQGREGTAALLAALLAKGAGERDAAQFQEAVDFVGGEFATGISHRWTSISAEFLTEDTDLALALLADVLARPRLDPAEFEKERGMAVDALRAARDEPSDILARYASAWQFGAHPFGRAASGDETSLAAVTLDDVRSAARRTLAPGRTWMAVAGDFDPEEMRRRLEAVFGGWDVVSGPPSAPAAPTPRQGRRVLLVGMPGARQTYFRFGNLGIDWSHPDYPARHLANTVLGGRFTSRLNTALRIESGLSYGARSGFDDDRAGAFTVSSYTATATSREALELALAVYRRFREEGLTQEELDSARSYVKGQFAPDTLETADQAASMILALAFDGLPRDLVDRFFERLDAVTLDEVNRVIRERFPGDDLSWVVIGEPEVVRPVAAELGTLAEVPIDAPGFGPR